MNIRKIMSVGLAASMLIPTVVSAAGPVIPNDGDQNPPIISNGVENTPNVGTGDNTGTNEGTTNPNTGDPSTGDHGTGNNDNPTNPNTGEPGNTSPGETTNTFDNIPEDKNIALLLRAKEDATNGYKLANPDGTDSKKISINKDTKNVYGVDWKKVKSIEISQGEEAYGKYNVDNTDRYMSTINALNKNLKVYADVTVKYEKIIKEWKDTEIAKLNETINDEKATEEDKQAAQSKIDEIDGINLDNIESTNYDIKNKIVNDGTYSEIYKKYKNATSTLPKLYVIAKITNNDDSTKDVKVQLAVTDDKLFSKLPDNLNETNIWEYINQLKSKYLAQRTEYEIAKARYEAEEAEYNKNRRELQSQLDSEMEKYKNLWSETKHLLDTLYNKDVKNEPGDTDADTVKKAVDKLKELQKQAKASNDKIIELEAAKKALEKTEGELRARITELEGKIKDGQSSQLTETQEILLKNTIKRLIESIEDLNYRYDAQNIAYNEVNRFIQGVETVNEEGKIVPGTSTGVNIDKFITFPNGEDQKSKINPDALIEYLLNNGNTEEGKKSISQLMENIKNIVTSYKQTEDKLENKTKEINEKQALITSLQTQLEEALKTDKETVGKYMVQVETLKKEVAQLTSDKEALLTENKNLKAQINDLNNKDKAELNRKLKAAESRIQELERLLKSANDALANYKKNHPGFEGEDISKVISDLESKLRDANNKLAETENKFKGIEEAINEYDNSTDKTLLEKVNELIEKVKSAGNSDPDSSAKIKELEDKIAELNQQIGELNKRPTNEQLTEVNNKLTKAEQDLATEKEKVNNLQNDLNTANLSISDLQDKLDKATQAGNISQAEVDRLKGELDSAKQQLIDKQADLDNKVATITDLNQQIADLNKTIKEKDATIADLREQLDKITKEKNNISTEKGKVDEKVNELNNQIEELNGKIAKKDEEIGKKNDKITELDSKVAANNAIIEEKDKLIKALRDRIATLEGQIVELTKQSQNNNNSKIEELKNTIESLNNKINELTTENQALKAENEQLKSKKQELEAENNQLKQDKQKLLSQLEAQKSENKKLLKQIAELQDQIANLRRQNEENLAKIKNLIDSNTELINKIATNETELARLRDELASKAGRIRQLTEENSSLKQQLEELKNSTKGSKEIIDALNKEIAILRAKVETLQQSVDILSSSTLSQKYIQSQKDLAAAKEQLEQANSRIAELERQLEEAKSQCKPENGQSAQKIAELERQLEASKAENTKLSQELADLKATTDKKIAELNKQLGIKDGTISELEKKLKEKEDELNRLLEEKNNIKKENDNLKKENDKLKENSNKQPETPNKEETGKIEIVPNKPEEKKPEVHGPVITNDKDFKQPEIVEDNKDKTIDNGIVNPSDNIDKQIEDTKKEIEKIKDDIKTVESGGVVDSDNTIVPGNNTVDIEEPSNDGKSPEYIEESGKIDVVTPEKGATFKDSGITPTYKEKDNVLNRFGEWILSNLGPRDKNLGNSKYIFPVGKSEYYVVNNGNKTSKTTDAAPFIQNGRTMFSVNEISKITGIELTWDNELKVATFNDGSREVSVQANNVQLVTNGNKVSLMDSKPIIKNDRLFMSITNLNKAFDNKLNITWNNSDRSVVIEK